jgi:hypothetical protein
MKKQKIRRHKGWLSGLFEKTTPYVFFHSLYFYRSLLYNITQNICSSRPMGKMGHRNAWRGELKDES